MGLSLGAISSTQKRCFAQAPKRLRLLYPEFRGSGQSPMTIAGGHVPLLHPVFLDT